MWNSIIKHKKLWIGVMIASASAFLVLKSSGQNNTMHDDDIVILTEVQPRSFKVEVHTIGELEAARSTIIASSIRGDQGKIIQLVQDGINVQPGDLLVKMDPTPFEEKIGELKMKIKDQKAAIDSHTQSLEWERNQAELERKASGYEVETAQLELDKTIKGDGPLELFRLQSAMQKAWVKYEELNAYSEDLALMEEQGYINHAEKNQAQKKLKEEQEAYENAKLQFETYSNHVHPMVIKKAETALRKSELRVDETAKASVYKIEKAQTTLKQAQQSYTDLQYQLHAATQELEQTEIKAPSHGMVVLREEYRAGQKRKPRVGDILVKNQPLLDLPDLNSMIVKTKVREVDLYKVQIGKPAYIEVDAYPQVFFNGKVQSIGVLALSDIGRSGVDKYFEVKIELLNSDERLRPGMTSRVTIFSNSVENSLTLPLSAIFEHNKKSCCYIAINDAFKIVPIKTGSSNEQWIHITSGLSEGDKVAITRPPQKLIQTE